MRLETAATIRDLLNERDQVSRYADVRAFTSQAPSRLEVLASDRDPAVSVAFGAEDYCDVAQVLEHYYSICITDCGTGLLHSAMAGRAGPGRPDRPGQLAVGGRRAERQRHPGLAGGARATATWCATGWSCCPRSGRRPRARSTSTGSSTTSPPAAGPSPAFPYDPHLEEGAEIELELLGSDTAEAYLALAAVVGDGLAWSRRRGG